MAAIAHYLLKLLLKYGFEVDAVAGPYHQTATPLYWAVKNNSEDMIKLLTEYGASLTLAWLTACSRKSEELMKRMISMGVHMRAKDKMDATH
jgi:ankyrin repeat protein